MPECLPFRVMDKHKGASIDWARKHSVFRALPHSDWMGCQAPVGKGYHIRIDEAAIDGFLTERKCPFDLRRKPCAKAWQIRKREVALVNEGRCFEQRIS